MVENIKKVKSREYPAFSLEETIEFLQILKGYPIGKSISYEMVAESLHVKTTAKSFTYKISAAKQFGLIKTSGRILELTQYAQQFLYPTENEKQLLMIKKECFRKPSLYKELIDKFKGKPLPNQDKLQNILIQSYGIIYSASNKAAEKFIKSANEVEAIKFGVLDMENNQEEIEEKDKFEWQDGMEEVEDTGKIIEKDGFRELETEKTKEIRKNDNINSNEQLMIPLGKNRKAILTFPSNINIGEADFLQSVIKLTMKQYFDGE